MCLINNGTSSSASSSADIKSISLDCHSHKRASTGHYNNQNQDIGLKRVCRGYDNYSTNSQLISQHVNSISLNPNIPRPDHVLSSVCTDFGQSNDTMQTEHRQLNDIQHHPCTLFCSNAEMEDMLDLLLQDAEYTTALTTTFDEDDEADNYDNDNNHAAKTQFNIGSYCNHKADSHINRASQQSDSSIISYGNSDDGDIDYEHSMKIGSADYSITNATGIIKESIEKLLYKNSESIIINHNLEYNMDSSVISTAEYNDEDKYNNKNAINHIVNQKATISTRHYAGPTLLDIESALASISPSSSSFSSSSCKPASSTSSININPVQQIKMTTAISCWPLINPVNNLGDQIHNGGFCSFNIMEDEDDDLSTWRKLHKRNQLEPRYTVKMKCEEAVACDGYRWRKYGQKTIKNSPYPRSYYRCSVGKCRVKKQVERCHEDAKMVSVTYEGIHLHKQ